MTWQPIETAPRGETRVLLYGPDGVDIGNYHRLYGWERDQTAEYDNDGAKIEAPTHWMPLPEPPGVNRERENSVKTGSESGANA